MKCPNCNNTINNDSKFCPYCRKEIKNDHSDQFNYSNNYSKVTEKETLSHESQYYLIYKDMFKQSVTSDEDYIKSYIGNNYDKIKNEELSIPGLIFGPFYLLYRKLWTYALAILILNIIVLNYFKQDIFILVNIIINIYLGLKINNILMQQAIKKVDEVKISYPNKSSQELLEICKKKGTINKNTIIITIIIIIIISILSSKEEEQEQKTNDYNQNSYIKENINKSKTYYQDKTSTMTYSVWDELIPSKYNTEDSKTYFYTSKNNKTCSITITENKNGSTYKTERDYIDQLNLDESYKEITTNYILVNNIPWNYTLFIKENDFVSYYVYKRATSIYIIETKGYFPNLMECINIITKIINSMTINS